MKRLILVSLLVLFNAKLTAQAHHGLAWSYGSLITQSQDTIQGKIHFTGQVNELIFKNDRFFKVYHTTSIQAFEYYDTQLQIRRYFKNFHIPNQARPVLFEKIIGGTYTLLRRVPVGLHSNHQKFRDYSLHLDHIYLWDGSQMQLVRRFKKQIKPLFEQYNLDLKALVKQQGWQCHLIQDQVQMIRWLNAKIMEEESWAVGR